MDIKFIESGITRTGILVKCAVCKKEFPTRKSNPRTCCSAACGYINSRKRIEVTCSNCGIYFEKRPSSLSQSKSGLYFCTRNCKDEAQRIGGIKEIMPPHYGVASRSPERYRRIYKEEFKVEKLFCIRCGYDEFECGVDIHHKDNNYKNNLSENLVSLCAPCHRALHKGLWILS